MIRHFLTLYLLIVATLATVSWGQDRLIRAYDERNAAKIVDPSQRAVFAVVAGILEDAPAVEHRRIVAELATRSGVELELFALSDIAGEETLAALTTNHHAVMSATDGRIWILERLPGTDHVLAFKHAPLDDRRSPLEWTLVFVFYAAIAFVLMLWLWPLTRDLRSLEQSTSTFGDRNWHFASTIGPRSQVYPLAEAFRRMAARIDRLISSHKDMSNALSHEIKTPLARMRFEIEMARMAQDPERIGEHLDNLNRDIAELNAFVTATLEYAILERAEMALNVGRHDFTHILPTFAESVQRAAMSEIAIETQVSREATQIRCDIHLLETVIRNLLHNAMRYARTRVRVTFESNDGQHILRVHDDGPGIPDAERERVFESFVQLERPSGRKTGFGLGLAIVKRAIEWHGGTVGVRKSELGGALFEVTWGLCEAGEGLGARGLGQMK